MPAAAWSRCLKAATRSTRSAAAPCSTCACWPASTDNEPAVAPAQAGAPVALLVKRGPRFRGNEGKSRIRKSCSDPILRRFVEGTRIGAVDAHRRRLGEPWEVARRGALVGGVVVLGEQARDELAPVCGCRERFPFGDAGAAVQRGEAVELRIERRAVGEEVAIFIQEQGDALLEVGREAQAA